MEYRLAVILVTVVVAHVSSKPWEDSVTVSKRRATNMYWRYWKDRVMPYTITPIYTADQVRKVKYSMEVWANNTCLTFREKLPEDQQFVKFANGSTCDSALGMSYYGQQIRLGPGCFPISTIVHEIGHALGLTHEHQHPDRDTGINILYHNIESKQRIWFKLINRDSLDFFGVDYDMDSVMHYESYGFSENHQRTMEARDPSLQRRLDNYYKPLSFSDVLIVNRMLNCTGLCDKDVPCPDDGFVDQNCVCHTPKSYFDRQCVDLKDGDYCFDKFVHNRCNSEATIRDCMKTCDLCPMYKVPRKELTGGCENKYYDDDLCDKWAREGKCTNFAYARRMAEECAKSCNYCGVEPSCIDVDNCSHYDRNDCVAGSRYHEYMMAACKNWCGYCGNTPTTTPTTTPAPACEDNYEKCKRYTDDYCKSSSIYYSFMAENCPKRCGFC